MVFLRRFFPGFKSLLLACFLGAVWTGCVRKSELTKSQGELAALQEKIRLLEQQRVPRAEFEQAQAAGAAAQEKLAVVTQELSGTREQLTGAQELLVVAQERESAATRRLSALAAKAPETTLALGLVQGTYTLKDDTIVYSRDAQLNFANGVTITSPTGMMLSDKDREIVAGNLIVETPRGPVVVTRASGNPLDAKPEVLTEHASGTK